MGVERSCWEAYTHERPEVVLAASDVTEDDTIGSASVVISATQEIVDVLSLAPSPNEGSGWSAPISALAMAVASSGVSSAPHDDAVGSDSAVESASSDTDDHKALRGYVVLVVVARPC